MANPQVPVNNRETEKPYSREEFTQWLARSCERQQLPVTIANPTVLTDIATLLR
ncbi:hypothetical protein MYCODSM44623_00336 [Mycobacterium intracellulare subsp. chimaera]|uniref:hypothetical protein n=1 Tax=Mycobacterium intracellulare TaxID=1767 RepID=UPI000DC730EF|nr:hypothetical protein [Mycobacterium intracellulare]ASL07119.1 hypothetical protein MYCODSM44623_00336 [Mycobacterium intracellulare subsp. chimaera]MCV7323045.1 hypothetical protein [Mycobacterium intracellulare subsp. chimaera]